MAKKKQFVTAAAAFAVAASAVAPAITADAASTTVRLKTDYVRSANLDAVLDATYQGKNIHWYKSSIDLNKLGVFQKAKGFVKGTNIKVEKSLRVLNYVKAVQPAKEIVLEQGVPASGLRVQPVLFADGNLYDKPVSVSGFNTDKVGEFEGTFTYANKAFGSVNTKVKYKVVASEAKVEKVSAITKAGVSFTIPATEDAVEGFTVEVKDNTGKVIEVNPVNLVKGETEVTLTFKSALSSDPTGVWTVGGVEFSLDVIKQYNDIVNAAASNNEVATLSALKKAGLSNIKDGNITAYVTAINASTTKEKLADIQVIIDKANATSVTSEEAAAAVKAVNDASNQVQLLAALQNKAFARVNADWIVAYNTSITTAKATPTNTNTVAKIQALVDADNTSAITSANSTADTVVKQNAVTELIKNYTADDVAPATTKANAIKASEVRSAVLGVKEATTAASVYNALVKLAGLDNTNLPTTSLNANLKAEYLTAKNAYNFSTVTPAAVKTNVVDAAGTAAANAALTAIDGITSTTETTDVKAKLQKLADVTSHLGNSKFDVSKVLDARLVEYRTALATLTSPTQSEVETAIASVNAQANEAKNLAAIKDASATVVQVRDALTELAAGVPANSTTTAYLNASSQVKLEVAQFVINNRSSLATTLTTSLVTATSGTGYGDAVIESAQAAQVAKVGQFNAIGNLTVATNSTTKAALDLYAYGPYDVLTAAQKVAVAEEINKLTKPTSATNPTLVALNFANVDAVSTVAQANAYIDAAINKVKGN